MGQLTTHVARTDHHVVALGGGAVEAHQIVGVVRKVAVHLADVVESVLQSPAESREVGRAQAQFPGPFHEVEPLRELLPALLDDRGRAVGRTVVDDEYIEGFGQREDLVDHRRNVLFFVIGRNDYQFAHGGCRIFWNYKDNIILQIAAILCAVSGRGPLRGKSTLFSADCRNVSVKKVIFVLK